MWKEFKEFIAKGNVLDAAIGFVLGLAFKAIIDSIVEGLLMPLVGLATSGYDLNSLKIVLREGNGEANPEVALMIGTVIQTIITFLIIAFVLFLIVKAVNKARRMRQAETVEVVEDAPAADVALLMEIRDLLKHRDV